ncbi:hypothetical protein FZEAL_10405 [Fusarium zealandicum]|uniref:Uncharacterized protein n=1 Tax=Fusarium zealandicum TaxID=1053134 RepID=A0A8H4XBN8_9HYPO|nr:hypothetical protein FZEAL_10405 [Fusarium zealandicum]
MGRRAFMSTLKSFEPNKASFLSKMKTALFNRKKPTTSTEHLPLASSSVGQGHECDADSEERSWSDISPFDEMNPDMRRSCQSRYTKLKHAFNRKLKRGAMKLSLRKSNPEPKAEYLGQNDSTNTESREDNDHLRPASEISTGYGTSPQVQKLVDVSAVEHSRRYQAAIEASGTEILQAKAITKPMPKMMVRSLAAVAKHANLLSSSIKSRSSRQGSSYRRLSDNTCSKNDHIWHRLNQIERVDIPMTMLSGASYRLQGGSSLEGQASKRKFHKDPRSKKLRSSMRKPRKVSGIMPRKTLNTDASTADGENTEANTHNPSHDGDSPVTKVRGTKIDSFIQSWWGCALALFLSIIVSDDFSVFVWELLDLATSWR